MNRPSASLDNRDADEYRPARLANYLDALYDSRKLIVGTTAVALIIGIGYAVFSQPVYRADVLVQVEQNANASTKNVVGDISAMFDVKTAASGEAQVLGKLPPGETVRLERQRGKYLYVRTGSGAGWIERAECGLIAGNQ